MHVFCKGEMHVEKVYITNRFFCNAMLTLLADTKPPKPAIKSSTLPRTSSQGEQ